MARVLSSVHATSTTCSVCWTSLCVACFLLLGLTHSMSLTRSMSLQSAFRHHEQAKKRELCARSSTVFSPPCAVFNWKFWLWSHHFLWTPGRSNQLQTTEALLQCNQLAKMSPLNCHPTICNYVCQGQSFISPLTLPGLTHSSCVYVCTFFLWSHIDLLSSQY